MLSQKGFPGIHGEHQWQPPQPSSSTTWIRSIRGFHLSLQAGFLPWEVYPPRCWWLHWSITAVNFLFPWGGNGSPLQYSCLENSMDRGAWQATVHRVAKSDTTEQLSTRARSGPPLPHLQEHWSQGFTSECTISLVSPLFCVHPTSCPWELHLTLSRDPRRASPRLSSHPVQMLRPVKDSSAPTELSLVGGDGHWVPPDEGQPQVLNQRFAENRHPSTCVSEYLESANHVLN